VIQSVRTGADLTRTSLLAMIADDRDDKDGEALLSTELLHELIGGSRRSDGANEMQHFSRQFGDSNADLDCTNQRERSDRLAVPILRHARSLSGRARLQSRTRPSTPNEVSKTADTRFSFIAAANSLVTIAWPARRVAGFLRKSCEGLARARRIRVSRGIGIYDAKTSCRVAVCR